jgi:hypothetical protein
MIVISLIQIEGVAAYLLKINMNIFMYSISVATIATIVALFAPSYHKIKLGADDFWILFIPTIIIGAVVGSMFTLIDKTDINNAVIYKTTTSTDESQHLNMFAQIANNDGNMTVAPNTYPTGWHLSMSVLVHNFTNLNNKPFMDTLIAYYITKMLGLFIVLMSVMVLFIVTAKKILKAYSPYYLLFAAGAAFLSLMILIPNSEINAFYNFVPQYTYFLLLLSLLMFADKKSKSIVYTILLIFAAASFISWILSGLIMLMLVLVAYTSQFVENKKINDKTQKIVTKIWQPVALAVTGGAVLAVAIPGSLLGAKVDMLEHPEGWIEGVSQASYLILFLLLVKDLFSKEKNRLPRQVKFILITYFLIISGIIVVTMLRGYSENISYYWQKIEFPILLMSIPIIIVLFIDKIQKFSNNVIASYLIVVILLIFSIPNVFGLRTFDMSLRSIGNQEYLHKTRDLNITKPIEQLFEKNTFKSTTAHRYVFATSSNYTLDQMVYQIMSESISRSRATSASDTKPCFPQIVPSGGYVNTNAYLLRSLPSHYCGHKVQIVVSNNTKYDTLKYVNDLQMITNINEME